MNRQIVKGLFQITKSGHTAHIILPGMWVDQEVEIRFTFTDEQGNVTTITDRKIARKFGKCGSHVYYPRKYVGMDVSATLVKFIKKYSPITI